MKLLLLLIFTFFLTENAIAQFIVKLPDGSVALLYENGTWTRVDTATLTPLTYEKQSLPQGNLPSQNTAPTTAQQTMQYTAPATSTKPNQVSKAVTPPTTTINTTNCNSRQCSGQTQKGSRCQRNTTNCSGRCYQH